ncbi:MAG: transposase [Deltaproteobacteria bacterium]
MMEPESKHLPEETPSGGKRLHEHIVHAEAQVKAMEATCEEEMAPRIRKTRERAVLERKERLSHAIEELEKIKSQKRSAQTRVSITDPECRIMGQSDGGYAPAYNVQLSADAHEKVIIAVSISQSPADQTLCTSAINEIEKTTDKLPAKLIVDAGFTTRDAILAAEGRSISRTENDPVIEAFIAKMETDEAKAIYRQRGGVAEFPNVWIKEKFRLRQFHLRGLVKTELEALWVSITYNVKLWIRLCWKPRLRAVG